MKNSIQGVVAQRNETMFRNLFNALPDPNLVIARAGDFSATYKTIRTDAVVRSCIQQRKNLTLSRLYELQGDENTEVYDFTQHQIENLNLRKIFSEMLEAPLRGYQALENYWRYEYYKGKHVISLKDIVGKPSDWFCFDVNNQLMLKTIKNPSGIRVKPIKFLVIQHESTYDNPYGDPILSSCLWPIVFKKGGISFWMRLAEKFGMPHLIGKTQAGYGTEPYENLLNALDDLIQDASAVITSTDSIDTLETSSSISVNIYKDFVSFANEEIKQAILTQNLTTNVEGGSYAASATHLDILKTIADADTELVQQAMNQVIRYLVELNFGKDVQPPKFIMYPKEDVDKPLAEVTQMLTTNGQIRFKEKYYIDRFGFKPDEFELIKQMPSFPFNSKTSTNQYAEEKDKDYNLIEDMMNKRLETAPDKAADIDEQIQVLLKSSNSYEEAKRKIIKAFPGLKTDALQDTITKDMFWSKLLGEAIAKQERENGKTE